MGEGNFKKFVDQLKSSGKKHSDYPVDPNTQAWFAAIDEVGKEALSREEWWKSIKDDPGFGPVSENRRDKKLLHYVAGRYSPWYMERVFSKDANKSVWAIWAGPYTSNGYQAMGVMQGGAISALFDYTTAQHAYMMKPVLNTTAYLNVQMKKPARPIPGVFRLDVWISQIDGKKIFVKASLSNGSSEEVFAEAESLLIDLTWNSKI